MENKTAEEVAHLKRIAATINSETRPIKGHTDPNSIQDCWAEINDIADSLYTHAEVSAIIKQVLDEAAGRAKVIYHDGHNKKDTSMKLVNVGADHIRPDKSSITNIDIEAKYLKK